MISSVLCLLGAVGVVWRSRLAGGGAVVVSCVWLFLLRSSGSLSLVGGVVRWRLQEVEACDDDCVGLEYPSGRVMVSYSEDMGLGG